MRCCMLKHQADNIKIIQELPLQTDTLWFTPRPPVTQSYEKLIHYKMPLIPYWTDGLVLWCDLYLLFLFFLPYLFQLSESLLCGMICRELVAYSFCLKPVKSVVRRSAITSHQAVQLAAGTPKLQRKFNAQNLWLASWGNTEVNIFKSTEKYCSKVS